MHVTVDDVNLCDVLECVYVKCKCHVSTAHELPDLYMGFTSKNMAVNSVQHSFLFNNSSYNIIYNFKRFLIDLGTDAYQLPLIYLIYMAGKT